MDVDAHESAYSLRDAEKWLALGTGAVLLALGVRRRSKTGALMAVSSLPLLYRAVTGQWLMGNNGDTKRALRGERGSHVRAWIHVDAPIQDVYHFWRGLANLPLFMSHLESVTETSDVMSHWVAKGPAGLTIEWDAEIINEIQNEVIGWRSLPGSDVVMAGSVNFDLADNGRGTDVRVHLQYAPPGGRAGALLGRLMGRDPAHELREDLRSFKHLVEARATPADVPSEHPVSANGLDGHTDDPAPAAAAPRRRSAKRTPPATPEVD